MYLINKDEELTPTKLGTIIQTFQTTELPKMVKWKKYYDGKQAITQKVASDVGRPNNKVVVNFCYNIAQNYLGYITGIPVAYNNDKFENIKDVLLYNDVATEDSGMLKDALIFGRAFEICYVDSYGKQRFKRLDPRTAIPVYDNTLEQQLKAVIRFWEEADLDLAGSQKYYCEVYDEYFVRRYLSNSGWSSFELVEEYPHFYSQVPITVFSLNDEEESIYNKIIDLQDGYNSMVSSGLDEEADFANAYLILKGLRGTTEDDLVEMKKNRVLLLDPEDDADWLTKNINDAATMDTLNNLERQIHKISNSPDFTDEKLMSQSGVAMRYKLIGFENASSTIEANMRKALQKRIELICDIFKLTYGEDVWRDVDIVFTRNLPVGLDPINMTVSELMSLKGTVSDRTLLTILPFIKDVDEEIKQVQKERELSMSLYSFPVEEDEEDDRRVEEEN